MDNGGLSSMFCFHMHTTTHARTGQEECNDTSKKKKERSREKEEEEEEKEKK